MPTSARRKPSSAPERLTEGGRIRPHKPDDIAFAKVLIHAPGGAGKTTFLGTAQADERTAPMALINFDAGTSSLRGLDIDVYDVRDMQDYEDVYEQLSDPADEHRSIGLDSVSETQVGGLFAILESGGLSKGGRANADTLEQSDWGIILVQMRRLIRHFKWLDKHVFMTALSKTDTLPRIGSVLRPALQGQFADDILGIPDTVCYLAQEDQEEGAAKRILLLKDNPKFMVKARTPFGKGDTVPSEIEDPTITKLLDALGF